MVDDTKERLYPWERDAVVERGCRVENDQRRPEDAAAHDVPGVSEQRRKGGQNCERHDREDDPDPVGDAVRQFLTGAVLGHGYMYRHIFFKSFLFSFPPPPFFHRGETVSPLLTGASIIRFGKMKAK